MKAKLRAVVFTGFTVYGNALSVLAAPSKLDPTFGDDGIVRIDPELFADRPADSTAKPHSVHRPPSQ